MALKPFNSPKRPNDFLSLDLRNQRDRTREKWLDDNGFEMIHWGHPRWEQWEYMLSSCRYCGTSIHTPVTKDVEKDLASAIIHLDWHAAADVHWNAHYKHTHTIAEDTDKAMTTSEPVPKPERKFEDYQPPGIYC